MSKTLVRCAIYTRKSTDEGLDQDFNSLDAQREACAAYITSQASLGWKLLPRHYDDGGISGGHMERPALQNLLQDIEAGKINTLVVYKIDRLTRSLADFSKMVEIFERYDVSFVSVTQQFNTTTSMGRLTLNVLLSFAQFEREVTAERIRDKIAASRRKGMWMGGQVPLGYDVVNKHLIVNQGEANLVRQLFAMYLELKSVPKLKKACDRLGLRTKDRGERGGKVVGDKPFARGHLYALLTNPLYIGQVVHRGKTYPGQHEPIIDQDIFNQVHALIRQNAGPRRFGKNTRSQHLLTGLLFDNTGDMLSPSHGTKNGKRYRYYVSLRLKTLGRSETTGWRLNAPMIEGGVFKILKDHLTRPDQLIRLVDGKDLPASRLADLIEGAGQIAGRLDCVPHTELRDYIASFVKRIDLSADAISIQVDLAELFPDAKREGVETGHDRLTDAVGTITAPLQFRKRGVETRMVIGDQKNVASDPSPSLIALIALAHHWLDCLTNGSVPSIIELARQEQVDKNRISRTLKFAYMAPDITIAILEGRQPTGMTADQLRRLHNLPMEWQEQRTLLGFN